MATEHSHNVSPEDEDLLTQYSWFINNGYLRAYKRGTGRASEKNIYLHQLIAARMGLQRVDHINRDRLDNRRENLREASRQQNNWNKSKMRNNKTGVPNVTRHQGRFRVTVTKDRKQYYGGSYTTIEEAKIARNRLVRELHGSYGREV